MKGSIVAMVIALALIGGALVFSSGTGNTSETANIHNVTMVDGKQIVMITAKGGYSPHLTKAKAGIPTTLRIETNGTFDCSSIVRIPSISYEQRLPSSGATDVELPAQKAGTKIDALCAMGMYNFTVAFE
jgi:Cu+-exporting ATPase